MGLGLQTEGGGGDYSPIVKFDARAGRMFRVDRAQDASGNWNTDNVEITNGFKAVMDFENIHVGYALFAVGMAPSFAMAKIGEPFPGKPTDQHKQGFKMMLKLGKESGGDVREFVSCAKAVIGAIDGLYNEYTANRDANPGKLPLVALTGSTPIVSTGKGQSSTNYAPTFVIERWIDRPADLGGAATASAPQPAPAPPPPVQQPQKVLQPAGEEF